MKTYELSIFIPLISGAIMVHVFQINVAQSIARVKEHADEMAATFLTGAVKNYCALNVREI